MKNYIKTYIVFGLTYFIIFSTKYKFIFGEYEEHLRQFSPVFNNVIYNLTIISKSFLPTQITNTFSTSVVSVSILLILFFVVKNFKNYGIHSLLIIVYFLFYSAYLNQQGIRFLLLLIPSLFFILYDFIKQKKYLIYAVSFLFLVNVVNYKSYEYELGNQALKKKILKCINI